MRTCAYSLLSSCRCYTKQKMRDWYLLRDEMRTCAFSLSIFMSFLYTNTNERLVVAQGRVPLAYVAHTGTRCAPVPSRFSSSCPCYTKQKCETGSYSGTRCAPVPSRFLSSCPYFTKPETKDGSYSGTRCYPKILKLSYLPYVPSLPYPHIYHRSFSVQVSLFVLAMTHCYWVLLRPPTKVGQSGGGSIYIYISVCVTAICPPGNAFCGDAPLHRLFSGSLAQLREPVFGMQLFRRSLMLRPQVCLSCLR